MAFYKKRLEYDYHHFAYPMGLNYEEDLVVNFFEAKGCKIYRNQPKYNVGVPDFLVKNGYGKEYYIEVKGGNGKLLASQKKWIEENKDKCDIILIKVVPNKNHPYPTLYQTRLSNQIETEIFSAGEKEHKHCWEHPERTDNHFTAIYCCDCQKKRDTNESPT